MKAKTTCTRPKYVCGNEKLKLIGTTDGLFPDFGHHLEGKMGGLWLYPIKILDGFWMRIKDVEAQTVDGFLSADEFENYPYKNIFRYGNSMGHTPIVAERMQLIPENVNGLIVTYTFYLPERAANGIAHTICTEFTVRSNLRPGWLSEIEGVFDGAIDEAFYHKKEQAFCIKDCGHDWYAVIGSDIEPETCESGALYGSEYVLGNGTGIRLKHNFVLNPGEKKRITFYIAASLQNEQECFENYQLLKAGSKFEEEKQKKYEKLLNKTRLSVGDSAFEEIFDWLKIHTDWLKLNVDGIGRGITAGIPEYVWWFGCDSCYALQGMMLQGDYEICRDTIRILLNYSKKLNGNGRIIHELLPNAISPNLGNCQETAHFINLLWEYYVWTGDKDILEEAFDYITLGMSWLLKQDDDNDCFPTGYGIIEIAGLNMEMIDSAVYTAVAFGSYANIAEVLEKDIDVMNWRACGKKAVQALNACFWSEEENCYCDCFASAEKIMEKKDMILQQMEEAGDVEGKKRFEASLQERMREPEKEHGWLLNKNWIINTPMEMGIAPKSKAASALMRLHTNEFIGRYGMYLEGLRKSQIMTISTGVMAVAQARYGYVDRALELIERMFTSFGKATPGSISEMSPNYGCFTQAWTAYGVLVPIVRYFFGISPNPVENEIVINPNFPTKWKGGKLENLRVLDGDVSISVNGNEITVKNHTSARIIVGTGWNMIKTEE